MDSYETKKTHKSAAIVNKTSSTDFPIHVNILDVFVLK